MTAPDSQLSRDLSANALRGAFAQHPSGLAALCTIVDGKPQGLVASSFTVGVSLEPPLVMFAVQKASRTWPEVKRGGRIGVSILSEAHQGVVRQIAARDGDRFAGLGLQTSTEGALFLEDAALWLETSIENEVDAGDHRVVLLRVHAHATHGGANDPLVFHNSALTTLSAPQLV